MQKIFLQHSGKKKWVITAVLYLSDACVPSWLSTRDGLIGSAFGASIVAYISLAAAVWVHVYYHIGKLIQVVSSQL